MTAAALPTVALVWTQFIPAHVDRCQAVAKQMAGKAKVVAVEIASTSKIYGDFTATGPLAGIDHRRLYPGRSFDDLSAWQVARSLLGALRDADLVCIGVPYSRVEVLAVGLLLRLAGKRIFLIYDSKFDDKPRRPAFEAVKRVGLSIYSGAIVASRRSRDYLQFLGFRHRPLLGGADALALTRIRADAAAAPGSEPRFESRDFVFVGRLSTEKNIDLLIDAYADWRSRAARHPRKLRLVGAGPQETALRARISAAGLDDWVVFEGFREGDALAGILRDAAALVLPSAREPWGLVVNEAQALGIPAIVSEAVGARDVLVRDRTEGIVVATGARTALAAALATIDVDERAWQAMRSAAADRAWYGDAERFADAVHLLVDPAASGPRQRMDRYLAAFDDDAASPARGA